MSDSDTEVSSRSRRRGAEAEGLSLDKMLSALDDLHVGELRQLQQMAEAKIREKADSERRALKEEMEKRMAELGVSVTDLFGQPVQTGKRGRGKATKESTGAKVPVKYRGPGGEEWSGRGRTPNWVQVAKAEGKSKEDFLI